MASVARPARKGARVYGPVVLAAVIGGSSLDSIAKSEGIDLKTAERALRSELRKRWIAPAKDYARLQIARLENIADTLKKDAEKGNLPTIDRLLKVLDRLDRYHGFTKLANLAAHAREDSRAKLRMKLDQMAGATEPGA